MRKQRFFYIKKGSPVVTSDVRSQTPSGGFITSKELCFHESWVLNTPKDNLGGIHMAIEFMSKNILGKEFKSKKCYEFKVDEERIEGIFSWFVNPKNVYSRLEEVK